MKPAIYMDNSATTPVSAKALEAMLPYFREKFGNPSAIHSYGTEASRAVEESRKKVAKALGAMSSEIFFTSGGTESNNWAIRHAVLAGLGRGKHVISSGIEHSSVLRPLERLREKGYEIALLKPDSLGRVSPAALEREIRKDTVLVSVIMASNVMGTIQDIKALGEVSRAAGAIFHVDAVQAAGHTPVNVRGLGVDLMSISGHKFHGPKGVGALFSKIPRAPSPFIDGGGQEKGARSGTENVTGIVGLAAALEEATNGMASEAPRLAVARDRLIEGILAIPGTQLTGDPDNRLPGHASFVIEGIAHGAHLINELNSMGLCASSGSACSASSKEASHALEAIGLPGDLAMGGLRLSLSSQNTLEEANLALGIIARAIQRVRDLVAANYFSHSV
ncbi:MAG: cysteine desulfurase [Deltaproteobacteria bacterium]|jgi:cysteine desulfurase|nr:cysteine desulfurase [Deltaproteobacteria bacterium]